MDNYSFSRYLRIVELMSGTRSYKVTELASMFCVSRRTVYRLFNDMINDGFIFEKEGRSNYRIKEKPKQKETTSIPFILSAQEGSLINMIVQGMYNSVPSLDRANRQLHRNISKEYYQQNLSDSMIESLVSKYTKNVYALNRAISSKKAVEIIGYQSGLSNATKNYIVEPYHFTANLRDVIAYDVRRLKTVTLKISRIGQIVEPGRAWKFEAYHRKITQDIFGMTGNRPTQVNLRLSRMALNLLMEEYPDSIQYITEEKGEFLLKVPVFNMKGIGRFVLGLADQIQIIDSPELVSYIKQFAEKHINAI